MKIELPDFEVNLWIQSKPRAADWLAQEVSQFSNLGIKSIVSCLTTIETLRYQLAPLGVLCCDFGIDFRLCSIDPEDFDPMQILDYSYQIASIIRGPDSGDVLIFCETGLDRSIVLSVSVLATLGQPIKSCLDYINEQKGYECLEEGIYLEYLENWEQFHKEYADLVIT